MASEIRLLIIETFHHKFQDHLVEIHLKKI